jgi:AraC-like DNA-binding protein
VLDIAYDCGFGDVSNFNRAFRSEFGLSPRAWKAQIAGRGAFTSAADSGGIPAIKLAIAETPEEGR